MTGRPSPDRADRAPTTSGEPPELRRVDLGQVPTWIRLRIVIFGTLIALGVGLLLDIILLFGLPIPAEVARASRVDILLSMPLLVAVIVAVTAIELRVVAATRRTVRLGLQLPEAERQRALRTALSFPVTLPLAMVAAGTLGNAVTFVFDLLGRSHTPWYAVHVTIITQCVMLCGAFPVFVFTRFTLRPFILAVAQETESLGRSVGLRGRIAVLLTTLAALVIVPSASLLSLQLDRQAQADHAERMQQIVAFLGHELEEMGLHSFRRWVTNLDVEDDVASFVQDDRGEVAPAAHRGVVSRAVFGAPRGGQQAVYRARGARVLLAAPVSTGDGRWAWVGVIFSPPAVGGGRPALLVLVLGLFLLAALLAALLGAGIAREIQAISGRLGALEVGRAPQPLSAEVGALAEAGRVIDAVNALLGAADQARVRGFLDVEASADSARSKTEFLANMSHDLRSPLTAILGFADFLSGEVNGPLDPGQRQKVARITAAANSLVALIDVLLDAAKADAGRLKLHRAWTPLAAVVSRAMDLFSRRVGPKGARQVRVELEPGLAPIQVDPDRTAQAVTYLLEELRRCGPEAELAIHAQNYTEGSQRGLELRLESVGTTTFDPDQGGLFEPLREDGPRVLLTPGPALARQILIRQHALLVPMPRRGTRTGFRIRFSVNVTGEIVAIPD